MRWQVAALGGAALLSGCELTPRPIPCDAPDTCDCPATRVQPSGECCPAWTLADATGACHDRPWTLPAKGDALGDPWAQNVSVAIDARGRALVAFASSLGLEMLEESAPGAFGLRHPGAAVGGVTPCDLVTGADGTVAFAWLTLATSVQTVFLSERDAAGTWKEPQSAADAFSFPTTAYGPRLATNAGGEWLLVWNQWESTPHYGVAVARKPSAHAAWQRPTGSDDVLSKPINYSNTPVVTLNDAGQAIITWYQSLGGPLIAFASERSGPGAAFSHPPAHDSLSAPGGAIDSDPIASVKPAIFADGSAAAVWTQENGKGATLVYIATRDTAGQWTRPRDLDDAFSPATGYARGVQLAFGPKGELYVIWYQDAGDGNAVYAARRRRDGTWAEPGQRPIRLSSAGAVGLFPRLAAGPDGGVVAVWNERAAAGAPMRIVARRADGAAGVWGAPQVLSPDTGDDVALPAVAMGPHDRAVAAWPQGPGPLQRVYVARVE
jgi:hypothetical protein